MAEIEKGLVFNAHREKLWDNLLRYNGLLSEFLNAPYYQWINGSFVSRKPFPADIDLVTWLPFSHIANTRLGIKGNEANFMFGYDTVKAGAWQTLKLDGFLEPVYPESHARYPYFQKRSNHW